MVVRDSGYNKRLKIARISNRQLQMFDQQLVEKNCILITLNHDKIRSRDLKRLKVETTILQRLTTFVDQF